MTLALPRLLAAALTTAFLLSIAVSSVAVGQEPAETIRIGSWNIEWLGLPDMRAYAGRNRPQRPEDLAAYIAAADVDVLAVEEIGVSDPRSRRSDELDAMFAVLKEQHGQPWTYVLFPKTDYPAGTEDFIVRGQHVGLAWRTDRATQAGQPFSPEINNRTEYGLKFLERRATAIKLSFGEGMTDVVFIPVHLKSNRNADNPDDATYTNRQRATEVAEIVRLLPQIRKHFDDGDVVILGDTNLLERDDAASENLYAAGFRDLNASDGGTTTAWGYGYKSAPFDRIFVTADQPEFGRSQQRVWRPADDEDDTIKDFRFSLSDHYLITAEIAITADDD